VPILQSNINWYQQKLGNKQTSMPPTGRGLAGLAGVWLMSATPMGFGPWMTSHYFTYT